MNTKTIVIVGLLLLVISQLLMSFGYGFLMSQTPIDYAHWAMLLGSLSMFALWYELPDNPTKKMGLVLMTLGIAGGIGMCTIDFLLWAADGNKELKDQLLGLVFNTPAIKLPFLVIGPALFYTGICIATYGLFKRYTWQVIAINIGAMMVGLGHMVLGNRVIPILGALMLLVGLYSIIIPSKEMSS